MTVKFQDRDAVVPTTGEFKGTVCTIHGIELFEDLPYRVWNNGRMIPYPEDELLAAPLVSKWEPGTRVRVAMPDEPSLHGKVGVVQKVNYASTREETSVVLDGDEWYLGAHFYDTELEAE